MAALLALALPQLTAASAPAKQPNFVILFGDDWGWGDLGANWPSAAQGMTPNLDKVAAEGIRFTDFHVGASVCSVSRAALLTGRLGVRTGVVHNFAVDSVAGLPRTERTIAELLKPAGYRTAACGKWHLGTTPGYHPTYRGFDKYIGLPYSVDMGCTDSPNYDTQGPRRCGKRSGPTTKQYELVLPMYRSQSPNCSGEGGAPGGGGTCNGDIAQAPVNLTTLSDSYADFASEFIRNASTDPRPFFLYVPFSHVHTPQYVAARNAGKSGKTGQAGHFYDSLLELDSTVGAIMNALNETPGVDDNTLVLVTGDNGPWEVKCNLTGSKGPFEGLWQKTQGGGGSSAKTTLWEAGHREVGLARWPTRIAPRVSHATVSSLDYLPTILSLAGVTLPGDREYDGVDISPILLKGDDTAGHATLFHPNSGASGPDGQLDAVRWNNGTKQWKAIWQTGGAPDCTGNKGNVTRHDPPLLFELSADPAESKALDVTEAEYAAALARIEALLATQMHSINTTFQSVVNYNTTVADEPCIHYPMTCRAGDGPAPPPPPPAPPAPPGTCDPSAWFNGSIPWAKQGPRPPFQHPVTTPTAAACCAACVANAGQGCAYWTWNQPGTMCYMKVKVTRLPQPHAAAGYVSGILHHEEQ